MTIKDQSSEITLFALKGFDYKWNTRGKGHEKQNVRAFHLYQVTQD